MLEGDFSEESGSYGLGLIEHLLISNMRIYDVLLALFSEQTNEDTANALRAQHMRGEFFYPPAN